MSQDVKYFNVNPGTMPGDADLAFVAQIYDGYGGITVKEMTVSTGAVGTFDLILMKYGSAGTVAGGTVANYATLGTATVWAVDTPKDATIVAAQAFVDDGEHLMLKKLEVGAGNDLTADALVSIAYVDGIVTDS
jgi:hypothetical protein